MIQFIVELGVMFILIFGLIMNAVNIDKLNKKKTIISQYDIYIDCKYINFEYNNKIYVIFQWLGCDYRVFELINKNYVGSFYTDCATKEALIAYTKSWIDSKKIFTKPALSL